MTTTFLSTNYLAWNLNVNLAGNTKTYVFPSINKCIIHYCDNIHATTGDCTSGGGEDSGFVSYRKNWDGTIAWFCYGAVKQQYLDPATTIYIGGRGLKQIGNHCVSLNSIYAERENLSDYWIHTIFSDGGKLDDRCALLYGKPDATVWDISLNEYIPSAYYVAGIGYYDLTGFKQTNTDVGFWD